MATTNVVNVDGARVAYRLHGRGPAVVLVSGTAALDMHWGPVIGELARHRTVISLDYSGSGDTTDDGGALSLQKLAHQVREVAGAAGVERFDLIGHSLGAAIAIQLAASSADRVRSLIVVAGFLRGAEPRLKLQFELWLDLLRTNRGAFLKLLLLSGLTPAFVSRVGISTIEDIVKEYTHLANWEGIARQVELDLAVDVSRQVERVTSPTLVVNCAYDQIVTQTPELAASIPGSTCQEISAGHLAFFEGADQFLSLATEFLRRHDA
ncbi:MULTISPECIES: alpha/beta fold hydrolase [Bradyrhizobium]|uniref:alpha/beta fold hydrolase n=1 Tax=Bradyrhizobium elkanii TaxID=29448 RepID=UPI00054F0903|nr:alpha/beta hydrolase [Bradyrhizobium elkanii]